MAGHSKFKNIMYRKGAQDKKRATLFAKLAKEIYVATKLGGPDPDANARLRLAITNARANRMPKDNIERAIAKGSGTQDATNFEEIRYEGYGPAGMAVIVEVLTDNRNRAASTVRSCFTKSGGVLAETGAVTFLFQQLGEISYGGEHDENKVFESAIEAGASDIVSEDNGYEILTQTSDLHKVEKLLVKSLGAPESVQLAWRPTTKTLIPDDKAEAVYNFINALDDLDDVQHIYSNEDFSEAAIAKLEQ